MTADCAVPLETPSHLMPGWEMWWHHTSCGHSLSMWLSSLWGRSEDRPLFPLWATSHVHLSYHLAPSREHHSTQYQCDVMPLPWLQLAESIHFNLATQKNAMSFHVICIQIQWCCATPLYLGKPVTWMRNDLVVHDRKKMTMTARVVTGLQAFLLHPEIGQFPPHFRAISLPNHKENLEKREKSAGANSKKTVDHSSPNLQIPVPCRGWTRPWVVLNFFLGLLTCLLVEWNVGCGRKHHKLCQCSPPQIRTPCFGLPQLHKGRLCLTSWEESTQNTDPHELSGVVFLDRGGRFQMGCCGFMCSSRPWKAQDKIL